ncbi:NfeD family protein [Glaciecola sp. XM2]|uniref:NfeD family protein n=1 Tax=Glaciecola sp. XM2 TaxID=1914931 RepID=UPI001BDE30FC|nr:NfeD family protein [Glaciecola sp. XM2]MBT1451224.1 NfeD family protein [Glaciecola sp. XM2]
MGWFSEHYAETLLVIGIILLAIEVLVLGFSTFFIFFVGLATIVTSALIYFGLIPDTWLSSLMSIAVFTAVFAALLWNKLRALQSKVDLKRAENDMIGHSFICPADIDPTTPVDQLPTHQYSGVNWHLSADVPIKAGSKVKVVQMDVGVLRVKMV